MRQKSSGTERSDGVLWFALMPAWSRNAGYDFILPIGYDRPWERRGLQAEGLEADPYTLQTYDTRLGNVLLLATHDAFFGDRYSLLTPNYGGGAYRNLRNIVVPLPFSLNCTFWRSAVGQRQSFTRRFRVSFAGSQNGDTRALIHRAASAVATSMTPEQRPSLAVRFVVSDEERAELSRAPSTVLGRWFGDSVRSFDDLLLNSDFCLVLPGDVSDLAMRFLHALSAGCTPVVVGGPASAVPLPFAQFVDYTQFARFARVRDVKEAEHLLQSLLQERPKKIMSADELEKMLTAIAGLYTRHENCGFESGEPFRALLAKSLEARADIWQHLRWYN
ncbi:ARAD2 [Symbiodinium sp. CCMP2592]|nr:ARAD2 [Symbiodinium sp. CCMP2592]